MARKDERTRFCTEAEAIARLQHPHIVQIYDIGDDAGRAYFTLEFCSGGSLATKLKGTPLPPAEAAALVEKLAQAMQAAHEKGVLHRDLKPANVLLTADGTPKITDFGLAKKLDEEGQTFTGVVMGTPSYMPPEQADGRTRELGPAADIYSLGAILYECLTGRPPFRGASPWDTVQQVLRDEPVSPRRLNPSVPADLETICLKCLRKQPGQRYTRAVELADDLNRWQHQLPIQARPVGRGERTVKWLRRNPAVAAIWLLFVLLLGVALAFAVTKMQDADRLNQFSAELTETNSQLQLRGEQTQQALSESERQREAAARLALAQGVYLAESNEAGHGVLVLAQALRTCPPHATELQASIRRILSGAYQTISPLQFVGAEDVSADGKLAVCLENGDTLRVIDIDSGRALGSPLRHPEVLAALFSPDTRSVLTVGPNVTPRLWDWQGGKVKAPYPPVPRAVAAVNNLHQKVLGLSNEQFQDVFFNPDGQSFQTVQRAGSLQICDTATSRKTDVSVTLTWIKASVRRLDPTGRLLLATEGGSPRSLSGRLYDAHTGRLLARLAQPRNSTVFGAAFSQDGCLLATGDRDGIHFWDTHPHEANLGKAVGWLSIPRSSEMSPEQENWCRPLAFSPDGRLLLTARYQEAQVWYLPPGKPGAAVPQGPPLRHAWPVVCGAFAPDNQTCATGQGPDYDGGVGFAQLWQVYSYSPDEPLWGWVSTAKKVGPLGPPLPHRATVVSLAFTADGRNLVATTRRFLHQPKGNKRVWRLPALHREGQPVLLAARPFTNPRNSVALSPCGRYLVVLIANDTSVIFALRDGRMVRSFPTPALQSLDDDGRAFRFSPDGNLLFGRNERGRLFALPVDRPQTPARVFGPEQGVVALRALSSDGRLALLRMVDNTNRLWNTQTGQPQLGVLPVDAQLSPDGRILYQPSENGFRLLDSLNLMSSLGWSRRECRSDESMRPMTSRIAASEKILKTPAKSSSQKSLPGGTSRRFRRWRTGHRAHCRGKRRCRWGTSLARRIRHGSRGNGSVRSRRESCWLRDRGNPQQREHQDSLDRPERVILFHGCCPPWWSRNRRAPGLLRLHALPDGCRGVQNQGHIT